MAAKGDGGGFMAHRCNSSCPEMLANHSTSVLYQCDLVCYRGCQASCLKDYDPLFQFETGVEGIFFGLGNSISLTCLALTLLTFTVFPRLQTIRGMAIMNLCVALFSAKLTFLVNPHFTEVSSHWCSTVAVLQHYFCLAAFHWVSVLAYDLFITVKTGRREETKSQTSSVKRKSPDSSHPRYLTYFLFAWGFPWTGVFSCATVEALQEFDFHYGNHEHCGVFGDEALLYSLAIPLTIITTINTGFFILITCHPGLRRPVKPHRARHYSLTNNRILQQIKNIGSKQPFVAMISDEADGNREDRQEDEEYVEEIKLLHTYACKSFLMATAWLSGFIAAFTHVYELWIIFIIMNAMQGIFMFNSFVLTPDVKKMWRQKWQEIRVKRKREACDESQGCDKESLDKETQVAVVSGEVVHEGSLKPDPCVSGAPM